MDAEVPYCILRQESSDVKDNDDPYKTNFDRFGGYPRPKKGFHGVGLAAFTFGTWDDRNRVLANSPELTERLKECVTKLSSATIIPKTYHEVTLIKMRSPKGRSRRSTVNVQAAVSEAKSKAPTSRLNPFYRDHAICMSALTLAEKTNEFDFAQAKRVGRIKIKTRHRTYVLKTRNDDEVYQAIGSLYNTDFQNGTKGYGKNIGKCVAGFRAYDRANNMMAKNSYFLDKTRLQNRTIASKASPSKFSHDL
jgi:hypothetical protein